LKKRPDGFAILRAVARHAEVFADVRAVVDKAALAILTAQLKARTCDLDRLKRTRKALGADTLALILKALPAAVPRSLAARIDPDRRKHAAGSAARTRSRVISHVMALAGGAATPAKARPGPGKTQARSANAGTKRGSKGSNASASKGGKAPRPEDRIAKGFWATSVMAKPQR
jgi:hypothetical protein